MRKTENLSIYVHIPFCVRKCNYCDFLSFNTSKELIDEYFDSLGKELSLAAAQLVETEDTDYLVTTVFFGGGTPSFVDAEKICDTLKTIRSSFAMDKDAEISIEVNPASAMYDKLTAYREAGFNRLSIGAQSLNDEELKVLGRAHNSSMFYETFENARKAGFDNINIDVMSALPGQSLDSYLETLNKVLELKPEHISAYSLIIEEGTAFYDMDLELPDEETDRAMYHETKRTLLEAGYHRYEISNYAREGRECRHNKVYWQRGNYLGLGIGAASMVGNVRWSNTRDIKEYTKQLLTGSCSLKGNIRQEIQPLSEKAQMEEFMFLGLRLVEGVSTEEFRSQFGRDIREVYGEVIDKYTRLGFLEYADPGNDTAPAAGHDQHLRLTEEGLDVSNTVMAEFLL